MADGESPIASPFFFLPPNELEVSGFGNACGQTQ